MTMGEWEWAHAAIGGVASIIFLVQTFGAAGDSDSDPDADATAADSSELDHDGGGLFHYLSVRNFVALFVGYGWVTLAALLSGVSRQTSSLLGVCAGIVMVFISLYLLRAFLKFQEDGTLDMESLAGRRASVYITIGASASSAGKVMVDTKAGRVELTARTNDPNTLRPGQMATIVKVDGGVLWVTASDE
jgi:membrane protein implicated in regulation of membrane protease activity